MHFIDSFPNQGSFEPGARVGITFMVTSKEAAYCKVRFNVLHLSEGMFSGLYPFNIEAGAQRLVIEWEAPEISPRGYGVVAELLNEDCEVVSEVSTAFDILNQWTDFPRYGFLSDFQSRRTDPETIMDSLVRYHINGLQFYDWMYRHEQFLTDEEPYRDLLNRELSLETVKFDLCCSRTQYSCYALYCHICCLYSFLRTAQRLGFIRKGWEAPLLW